MSIGRAHDNIDSLMLNGYKGTLPLTMEMFPEKRWSDDQGRQWTSNIKTRLEKDNGKWYLFPTMMGGLDLPEAGAYRGALKGKHFGVYDSYDEGMKADRVIHNHFEKIKGYQNGGTVEPISTNVHNRIDDLILKADLDKFDQTGVMRTQPENPRVTADALSRDFVEGLLPIGAGIKLFRGVPKWAKRQMVKGGSYKSPPNLQLERMKKQMDDYLVNRTGGAPFVDPEGYYGEYLPSIIKGLGTWASKSKKEALSYANLGKKGERMLLEFDVPNKVFKENIKSANPFRRETWFEGGIPKEYLKKVHKGFQSGGVVQNLYSMI